MIAAVDCGLFYGYNGIDDSKRGFCYNILSEFYSFITDEDNLLTALNPGAIIPV